VSRTTSGDVLAQSGEDVLGGMAALAFTAPGPGRVTISYEKLPRERIAAWTSLAALGLGLVALAWSRPIPMAERIHPPSARRISAVLGLITLCLLSAWAVRRQGERLAQTWAPVMTQGPKARRAGDGAPQTFGRDLVDDRSFRTILEPGDICEGILTKDSMPGCSAAAQRPRVSMTYKSPYLYRCLLLTVPAQGRAQVIVDELEHDEVVIGFLKRLTRGRGAEQVTWTLAGDDRERALKSSRSHLYVAPEDHTGTFSMQFDNANPHAEQLCLSLATVR